MIKFGLLISLSFLIGCGRECPIVFQPGQIVKHKLLDEKYLVIKQSPLSTMEGHCLVDVRSSSGMWVLLSVNELEPIT